MDSRLFGQKAKQAAAIAQGKQVSGSHADHIVPHCHGGETTVDNLAVVSPRVNLAKSAFVFKPREWQERFFRAWERRREGNPFLLVAVPGGGKTMAAMHVASKWRRSAPDRRLLVVVPTDQLRTQWQEEASLFGIDLQSKEFAGAFKSDFDGGVTTYAMLCSQQVSFRAMLANSPTMVVFDEIHHLGDEASFGKAAWHACENSREVLSMSGTPWRTEGTKIPFCNYSDDGYVVPDFVYEYDQAISDGVIRYLTFLHSDGAIEYDDGTVEAVNAVISKRDAEKRLRKLLDPDGQFIAQRIVDAHAKLMHIRNTTPDAAAIAACIDQHHAIKVAAKIKQLTGCKPSVIVSDTEKNNDDVKRFRNCSKEWIVTVRKVSEGTDIKRLQVLCYFTNVTSDLFFRQIVGRVSRYRGGEDSEGYVYLPSDPRLIACAQNINDAQIKGLTQKTDRDGPVNANQEDLPFVDPFTTRDDGIGLVFIGGQRVTPEVAARVAKVAEAAGISMLQALKAINAYDGSQSVPQVTPQATVTRRNLEDELQMLRVKCSQLVSAYCAKTGKEHAEVHGRFVPHKEATVSQMKHKQAVLAKWLRELKR